MADKLLLVTHVHRADAARTRARRNRLPIWLTVLIISRDVVIVADGGDRQPRDRPRTFRPSIFGKIATATYIVPRVFQEDSKADNEALQPLIRKILAYPLSEFDGTVKTKDWSDLPRFPWIKLGDEEWKWVDPATFFDVLPRRSTPPARFPAKRRSMR